MKTLDVDLCSIQEARDLVRNGKEAANQIAYFSDEQIDAILKNIVKAVATNAYYLADLAVEETGFGKLEDKAFKNYAASTLLYDEIKEYQTTGILQFDEKNKIFKVAEPMGLILGITPSTNPTSTIIYKSMISIKARNAIVFAPHPSAKRCSVAAAELVRKAAVEAGAPESIVGCVMNPTLESTNELMHSKDIALIIATGGPGMVKAAYSSGKPAIGVGAGNSPTYIEKTADVKKAISNIVASKTFDNGTICASEQAIICEEANKDLVLQELEAQGCYLMTKEETDKVCQILFRGNSHGCNPAMNPKFVGQPAIKIAEAAGISVPSDTNILVGPQVGVGQGNPLSFEKLTTVLGFYVVKDWEEACALSIKLLQNGIGHTMSLHTGDPDMIFRFSSKPASRILINTGGSQGGTGISTGLPIAFTLGCGTDGGSSVSDNLTPEHLINIKTVAYGVRDVTQIVANDHRFQALPKQTTLSKSEATVDAVCSASVHCTPTIEPVKDTLNQTPQDIQAAFERRQETLADESIVEINENIDNEAIVREILSALKKR
ncbi:MULTISPECIES: acetaldehyde dehydrogenase (acetylating) [Streptococcus]|uniref:acetaldehyde dehydrogenase (acetylating) n=1 Tax=Streptococcus TaxID=1301 RepID=UPI000CF4F609|nr:MULTISPECIES: acetaldehyde dehydrogenase (acetylating) [Streptococcus]AWL25856.1 acetaldehyde dehydrogenase (acetylating) [Streptococcus suis]MBY0718644.1 acetaldehyde dehydrogenase (acetylating) [Streptococcus sp. 2018110]MCB2860205.1 acetaldehyde dehydrogenase (acetylating) [Streptococcus suis]MCB2868743.1 acetaldehyde dehydrogenase (acetylating) [Streptococcus suis]MCO8178184.1 acetaldehyde dehydrogenase (acetylating) [Streptococcus suis]